jgi:hypothetical protein
MNTTTVQDHEVRSTVADLRATFPDAYISVRPSAQLGYAIIDCYPEG